jgi:hypothetical protein
MPPTSEPVMTYYQKNKDQLKEYKLFQWYKKNHDIPKEICDKYKTNVRLYVKMKKLLDDIQNKCPELLDEFNISLN